MATITLKHIKAAFTLAGDVYDGKIQTSQAAKLVHQETGLNEGSARDYFAQFRRMLKGETFKRSQSAEALSYFLPNILNTRGRQAAENALIATWKHIAYYESLDGTHLNKLRAVTETFQASLSRPISAGVHDANFEAAVVRSQQDSETARNLRLHNANPVPLRQTVTTTVFSRNPDVVAAVLARAQGVCEGCIKPAPFARISDGSPFLEVHHRKHLAHQGHDTVENALALCPNCHRKKHHG